MSERMNAVYRWAWFALACVALVLFALLNRWRVIRCDGINFVGYDSKLVMCYVQDRWTGNAQLRRVPVNNLPARAIQTSPVDTTMAPDAGEMQDSLHSDSTM